MKIFEWDKLTIEPEVWQVFYGNNLIGHVVNNIKHIIIKDENENPILRFEKEKEFNDYKDELQMFLLGRRIAISENISNK